MQGAFVVSLPSAQRSGPPGEITGAGLPELSAVGDTGRLVSERDEGDLKENEARIASFICAQCGSTF